MFQYYVRFGTISNLGRFTGRHARKQACCTSLAMQRDSFSCRRARTQHTCFRDLRRFRTTCVSYIMSPSWEWKISPSVGIKPPARNTERSNEGDCLGWGDESERRRAESQWIVAARPLCHLQYPVAYLSRLQRILPAA